MPPVLAPQRSSAWYAAREKRITASIAAACLGLDPYRGPLAAYNEIMGLHKQPDNPDMKWGRENEDRAIAAFETENGLLVERTGLWIGDGELSWLGASPDGLVEEDALLETKCPRVLPPVPPTHHKMQMIVQMAVVGRPFCYYMAWTPEGSACWKCEREPESEAAIIDELHQWYLKHIVTETPPPRRRNAKS